MSLMCQNKYKFDMTYPTNMSVYLIPKVLFKNFYTIWMHLEQSFWELIAKLKVESLEINVGKVKLSQMPIIYFTILFHLFHNLTLEIYLFR